MSLIVPIVVFAIAVAMGATAGARIAPPYATSAWLLPLFVSIAMALVAAVLVIGEIVQKAATAWASPDAPAETARSTPARIVGWLALSAGYALVTPKVGFEWATVAFLILALKAFGGASWRLTLAIAVTMALMVPLVFRHVFSALVP